jgi:hypothetical protein
MRFEQRRLVLPTQRWELWAGANARIAAGCLSHHETIIAVLHDPERAPQSGEHGGFQHQTLPARYQFLGSIRQSAGVPATGGDRP